MANAVASCPPGDPPTFYPIIMRIPGTANKVAALALVKADIYVQSCPACQGTVVIGDPTVGHGNPAPLPYNANSPSSVIYDEENKVPSYDRYWSALPAPSRPGYFTLQPEVTGANMTITTFAGNAVFAFSSNASPIVSSSSVLFQLAPSSTPGYSYLRATVPGTAYNNTTVTLKTVRFGLWELQLGGDGIPGLFRFIDPAPGGTLDDKKFALCTTNCPANFTQECVTYFDNLIALGTSSTTRGTLGAKYYDAAVPVLKDYCQGDKLPTRQCATFCNASQVCDTALKSYCSLHQNDTKTCPCYLPNKAYQDYLDKLIASVPANQRDAVTSYIGKDFSKPNCFYPPCQIGADVKPNETCPNTAIGLCVQNTEIKPTTVGGGITSTSQCLVNLNNKNVSTPTTSKPPIDDVPETPTKTPAKSSLSLYILIGGGILILVIIIILVVVLMKRRAV